MTTKLPKSFLARLNAVTAKRARTVIDHILKHGQITTEDLKDIYGYDHPPRAARDVRELGIPLETFRVKGSHGKKITAYRFGDPRELKGGQFRGRKALPKSLKKDLVARSGVRCELCVGEFGVTHLHVDHCVPFEISGDPPGTPNPDEYMLACGSCNRAKSWSCEHCENWLKRKDPKICKTCYWASPQRYRHIALKQIRRLDLIWQEDEIHDHQQLAGQAAKANQLLPDFVKDALRKQLANRNPPRRH